jgi:hypothetical protein
VFHFQQANAIMPKQTMKWRTIIIPVFGALLFFGALAWAKSDDPFSRKWFSVRTPHGKAECVAVLPKIGGEIRTVLPLVVYLHDSGGTLMTDGKELRQLAELGMVAVSLEYNQTNNTAFEEEYSALLDFLQKQTVVGRRVCRDEFPGVLPQTTPSRGWASDWARKTNCATCSNTVSVTPSLSIRDFRDVISSLI